MNVKFCDKTESPPVMCFGDLREIPQIGEQVTLLNFDTTQTSYVVMERRFNYLVKSKPGAMPEIVASDCMVYVEKLPER